VLDVGDLGIGAALLLALCVICVNGVALCLTGQRLSNPLRARQIRADFRRDHRATVAPAACDYLGHMNAYYFAPPATACSGIMVRLGLGPDDIRRRRISFAVVRAETDFHRELLAGDVVVLESTVVKLGEKSATFQHRLKNAATGGAAMSTEFKCVLLDLDKREATTIPEDIRAAAARLMAEER
jgi:acyl-CoA thioesterase FadM